MEFQEDYYFILEDLLEDLPDRIVERAILIAEDGSYGDILFDKQSNTLSFIVHGTRSYDVKIKFNREAGIIKSLSCSCPYGDTCKHLGALALIVLEGIKPIFPKSKKVLGDKTKMQTKLKNDTKTNTNIISGPSTLVIGEELHWHQSKNKRVSLSYNQDFEHVLIGDGQVMTTIYEKDWSGNRIDIHKTNFKIEPKSISIKCDRCTFTKKICQKAFISLENLMTIVDIRGVKVLNYSLKMDEISHLEKTDRSITADLFELEITTDETRIRSKSPSILMPQLVDVLKQNLQFNDVGKNEEYVLDSLDNSMRKGEAMVWSSFNTLKEYTTLFLISGKVNQAGDKLTSHLETIDTPILLSAESQDVYRQLLMIINNGLKDDENRLSSQITQNMINYLSDNIDVLQNTIQYSYKPEKKGYHQSHHIRKMDFKQFHFSNMRLYVHIKASKENSLYVLHLDYMIGEERIDISAQKKIAFNLFFVIINSQAYIYENARTIDLYTSTSGLQEIKFLPRNKADFFQLLTHFEKHYNVERDQSLYDEMSYVSELSKRITLKEKGHYVLFYPQLVDSQISYNVLDSILKLNMEGESLPDPQEMESFRKEFCLLHPNFHAEKINFSFALLHRDDYIKDNWHLNFFAVCRESDIEIIGLDDFKNLRFSPFMAEIKTEVNSSIDWFELDVVLTFGSEKVDRKKWIKAIQAGQEYIELEDGTIGLFPDDWFNKMRKIITLSEVNKKGLRIDKLRFNVIDDLFDEIKDKSILDDINDKRARLESYSSSEQKPLPKHLKADLRPYQEESYQWLKFLESCRFGGILADDMGLGKTLQVICFLASAKEEQSCHALVVVPKSLLFNWANEIEKFYPNLNYHIHHGVTRHEDTEAQDKADVIISTYGTVTKDITSMRETVYTHIILDESQAIKNPTSKRYKAIRLLQSSFKLCVTGTPIQNNTFDLYAQATFTNPGLLGNQSFFRQNFATPIDKEGDTVASDLLLKMISPFLLRRTKEQVAQDLPDKIESIMYCEMPPHQRKMYTELKEQIRRDILSLDEDDSQLKFKVLDGLLRLRQLCNAPLLVDKTLKGDKAKSVKIDSLIYTLTEEIGDGNALVFSQFVQMLSLIRKELDDRNIPYAYLDGSTRDREAAVSQFMEDDSCKIFLISLKAGNTGLNLTKAQYVFIVDPWWNPAVEAQAIDRTHRIGQNKKVFAYKMICKDTVEEKILLLQNRKSKVAKKIIQAEESSFKNLDKKQIMDLLA